MSNRNLLRTQYRTPTLESLKLQLGYHPVLVADREHNDAMLLKKYQRRFVTTEYKDNKVVQIDSRTGKEYNQNEVIKYINLNKYGTETPDKDYAYLKRQLELNNLEERINKSEEHGPLGIRKFLSRKTGSGSTVVEGQHQTHLDNRRAHLKKERDKLAILKKGTSFGKLTAAEIKEQNINVLGEQNTGTGSLKTKKKWTANDLNNLHIGP